MHLNFFNKETKIFNRNVKAGNFPLNLLHLFPARERVVGGITTMELFTGGTFAVIRKVVAAGWKGGCCSFVAAAPAHSSQWHHISNYNWQHTR